ncbi:TLC domain-containing protein 5-like isoform X2 [Ostrinia nubilalis]|uniref:TLC domain-containing protein 5-like isoform X2 n=2 Tax=Ostrinia TaxID=29056 RepID=UPI003082267C
MAWRPELSPASLLKLVSFLNWGALYLWCCAKWPKQSPEWCSRLVTVLHGSVATAVGIYQCGVRSITPWRLTMKITSWHYALMVWSWGYFAFDLIWCLVYWTENTLMLCHHTSALYAITIYMQKQYTGCTFACTLAMMEVTNPFLQARWFLRYEGYDTTMLYFLVEVTYLLSFLAVRGVLGTWVIYRIVESDIFDMDEKIISVIFYFVSLAFIRDIVGYIVYRYRSRIVRSIQKLFGRSGHFVK